MSMYSKNFMLPFLFYWVALYCIFGARNGRPHALETTWVPPRCLQLVCWNLNPQWKGVTTLGLWEVTQVYMIPWTWNSAIKYVPRRKRTDHMFSTIWFNRRQVSVKLETGLTDNGSASAHRLDFPASRAMRNSQVLLEPQRLWYLITTSQTKIS